MNVGYFQNEIHAAMALNQKCADLNVPLKNPRINIRQQGNYVTQFYFLIVLEMW